jgi:multiple sugar transport system permease protein
MKPGSPWTRGRALRKDARNGLVALAFLVPNLAGFLAFMLIPIVSGIALSLFKWDGANTPVFIGVRNFTRLLRDSGFLKSLVTTFAYTGLTVPATVLLSLLFAVLLTRDVRGTTVFRSVIFFPYVASIVAVSIVWQFLYSPEAGPINQTLMWLGVADPPRWTSSKDTAIVAVSIMNVWRSAGYYMVLFIAGIQAIPTSLYDAGELDGANSAQRFWHITRPMLSPTTFFVLIISVINSFQAFTSIYVMTGGGPGEATQVLVFRIYEEAFVNTNFGYASAQATILFAIVLIFTIFQFGSRERNVVYMA